MGILAWRPLIERAAEEHGLDPDLLEAFVTIESSGRADAFRFEPKFWARYLAQQPGYSSCDPRRVSSSYGLCQIMYPVAKENGFVGEPEMLFVPMVNLEFACRQIKKLLRWAQGDLQKAVGAYNAGMGAWDSMAGNLYRGKFFSALAQIKARNARSAAQNT